MPELPEVAALTDFLDEHLRGAVVKKIQLVSFAVLKTADPLYSDLEGSAVTGVRRFGKFVSMEADGLLWVDCLLGSVPAGAQEGFMLSLPGLIDFNPPVSGETLFVAVAG